MKRLLLVFTLPLLTVGTIGQSSAPITGDKVTGAIIEPLDTNFVKQIATQISDSFAHETVRRIDSVFAEEKYVLGRVDLVPSAKDIDSISVWYGYYTVKGKDTIGFNYKIKRVKK